MALSWRDALKQAGARPTDAAAAPMVSVAPAQAAVPVAPAQAAGVDPARVSPTLAALLDERTRMEAAMAALTGAGDAGDPRYAVAPLAARRAELGRWAQARDDARAGPTPVRAAAPDMAERTTGDRSIAGRMIQALSPVRADPPLRATAGEVPGGTPGAADAFAAVRDAAAARARADLSGLTDKAFDRFAQAVVPRLRGEARLARARRYIPDDWAARARRMIPDFPKDTPYAKRVEKLLQVAVGEIDALTDRAEKMRDLARDVRDLREADEANDEKRRDRAIERLRARKQEG